jgi:flagellar operon protein
MTVVVNNGFNSIQRINGIRQPVDVRKPVNGSQDGFESVLREAVDKSRELKFSKHAEFRLQARNISLTQDQKDRMTDAVSKAEAKGVKDSLVLMDNLAFVVNVRNRTVITAVNSSELKENVFTNIDGAVIV